MLWDTIRRNKFLTQIIIDLIQNIFPQLLNCQDIIVVIIRISSQPLNQEICKHTVSKFCVLD